MFYGADKEAEKVYTFKKPFKPREIVHENTRFKKGKNLIHEKYLVDQKNCKLMFTLLT